MSHIEDMTVNAWPYSIFTSKNLTISVSKEDRSRKPQRQELYLTIRASWYQCKI